MRLSATETPNPSPTPPPAPPAPARVAEPATAVIFDVSVASTETEPVAMTVLLSTRAVTVFAIALIDSAPAPEKAMPPAAPPAPASPKPTDHVSIVALPAAEISTVPAGAASVPTDELSTAAVTVRATPLIAREFASAAERPPPAPPAPAAARAPASALIMDLFVARTLTAAAKTLLALRIFAWVVATMVLIETPPASPAAIPPPAPPAPARAP